MNFPILVRKNVYDRAKFTTHINSALPVMFW